MRATAPVMVSERDFARQLGELARLLGWRRYHTWLSKHSARGFPDEVLVRSERLIFAELKNEAGKLTTEQAEWLDALRSTTTIETYVWRPADLEKIAQVLR